MMIVILIKIYGDKDNIRKFPIYIDLDSRDARFWRINITNIFHFFPFVPFYFYQEDEMP